MQAAPHLGLAGVPAGFDRSLAAAYPDCTVAKGLAIAGTDAQNHPDKVQTSVAAWLDKLGF